MRETVEFRIPETDAARYLPPGAGVRVGIARKIEVLPSDPLFAEIGRIDRQLREGGKGGLFTAWIAHRRYSGSELLEADLVLLKVTKIFEPAGEECGTRYDEASACPVCGSGAQQVTPLFLDGRRIPSRAAFALTIAGELITSRKVAESWRRLALRGAQFEPVRLSNKGGVASQDWFQLNVVSKAVDLDASSRVGRNPFNEGTLDACPRGDLLAYSLLSEASIASSTHDGSDVVRTRQFFGVRRGLLRPQPLILLSRRAWSAFDESDFKGFKGEVAHLV
jgi:hypothetical protein